MLAALFALNAIGSANLLFSLRSMALPAALPGGLLVLSAFLPAFACLLLLPLPAPPRCLLSRCPLVPFLDKPMVALKRSPLVLLARLRRLRLPCVPGPRSCSCPVCSFSANLFAAIWYSGSVLPPSCSSPVFSSPYICSFIYLYVYIYIYIGVPCPVDTPSLGGGEGPQSRGGEDHFYNF